MIDMGIHAKQALENLFGLGQKVFGERDSNLFIHTPRKKGKRKD